MVHLAQTAPEAQRQQQHINNSVAVAGSLACVQQVSEHGLARYVPAFNNHVCSCLTHFVPTHNQHHTLQPLKAGDEYPLQRESANLTSSSMVSTVSTVTHFRSAKPALCTYSIS